MNETNLPDSSATVQDTPLEDEILLQIIGAMRKLDVSSRRKILQVLATHFDIEGTGAPRSRTESHSTNTKLLPTFSEDRTIPPKQFMLEKKPVLDVERVACLAYYLTHYRDTPEFKTLDLSKLNTEAAQIKFSNAAFAVNNAVRSGLLVPSTKGNRQISATGEMFVQALPDRGAAKAAIAQARPRRKARKTPADNAKED